MAEEKLLHRERIIQIAGGLMMVSPFFNFFLPIVFMDSVANRWSGPVLWQIAMSSPLMMWALYLASMVVGFLMLKGRRASWMSVLVLLGLFIVYGVATLKRDMRNGWVAPVTMLLTNIGLFGLIYSQEFYQVQQLERLAKLAQRRRQQSSPPLTSAKAPMVELEGFGTWAKLIEVTPMNIWMRAVSIPPQGIETRTVEIRLNAETAVLARFARRDNSDYHFECVNMNEVNRDRVTRWIVERAA